MKIVHVTKSDSQGGAARAAFRVHQALCDRGLDSWMVVDHTGSGNRQVISSTSSLDAFRTNAAMRLNRLVMKLQSSPNPTLHSPAVFSGSARRRIVEQAPDVVNLHWLGAGLLTVREIGSLDCPVIWRLADMWAYCGSEHLDGLLSEERWMEGYTRANRPYGHTGFDIDRWTWLRKKRSWRRPYHIVAPSGWAADRVEASALLGDWPVSVIPNPVPLDVFRPYPTVEARRAMRLPVETPLVLFGADGGTRNSNKGFDLLEAAMVHVASKVTGVEAVVFGQGRDTLRRHTYPIHWMGRIDDDERLAMLYSACDVMVVPSRQESFGQTGAEAQACGTPVVAFENTGLEDVVAHERTGYLARHMEVEDLAFGIRWVLEELGGSRGGEVRNRAVRLWAPRTVAAQYIDLYERAIAEYSHVKE